MPGFFTKSQHNAAFTIKLKLFFQFLTKVELKEQVFVCVCVCVCMCVCVCLELEYITMVITCAPQDDC